MYTELPGLTIPLFGPLCTVQLFHYSTRLCSLFWSPVHLAECCWFWLTLLRYPRFWPAVLGCPRLNGWRAVWLHSVQADRIPAAAGFHILVRRRGSESALGRQGAGPPPVRPTLSRTPPHPTAGPPPVRPTLSRTTLQHTHTSHSPVISCLLFLDIFISFIYSIYLQICWRLSEDRMPGVTLQSEG